MAELDTVDALAQLSFVVTGSLERIAADHGLSLVLVRVLGILRDRTPTMNELAALIGVDKSSATGLVDRAARRDLVRRVPSERDRRVVQVELTGTGRDLVTAAAQRFAGDVTALLGGLSPAQRRTLTRLAGVVLVDHARERGVDLFALSDS